MPFVEAKCTNCGAVLSVDNTKNLWICNYCQTAFIFEKAINNYTVTNYNNITANTINVFNVNEPDFVIKGGKLKVYRGISRDVVIPNIVEEICESAFLRSTYLKSVIIPNSVKKMEYAFKSCTSLQSVDIQYGVTNISNAFEECTSLKSVTIPNSVKKMEYAFKGCTSLKSVIIPNSVTYIESAFSGCTLLKSIKIPDSIKKIDKSDFDDCVNLTDIDYPYLSAYANCFPAIAKRKEEGLCIYCGGKLSLLKKCKSCGRKN